MARCASLTLPLCQKAENLNASAAIFSYKTYNSIAEVNPALWDALLPADNLLLSRSYLQALEASTEKEVTYRYLIIEKNNLPAGLGFFQVIRFKGSNVVNPDAKENNFLAKAGSALKSLVVKAISGFQMHLLVSGNTFITGEYGFYFSPELQMEKDLLQAVNDGIEYIIAESTVKISGILIKDYYEQNKNWIEQLKKSGCLEFRVNPNMLLDLRPSWRKFDDYLGDMASKYRTRMKKALKRADGITVREMEADELEQLLPQMSALYNEVVDEADFKLAKLDVSYIVKLKKELGARFGVIGFFKENELLTFISYYLHERDLVAGYMGLKHALNHEHDLYLNVLLKLVDVAISKKLQRVVYGRTAMEIKSSVGAVPHPMYLYVRHRSAVVNFIIQRIVKYLSKEPEWTLRSPFKEDASNV